MLAQPNIGKATDEIVLDLYRSGNPEGMGILYQRYFKKVYYKCLSLCRDPNDAYDLAQESILKAFDQAHTFQGKSSFSTWLYTITYNHCRAYFKKRKHVRFTSLDDVHELEDEVSTYQPDENITREEQETTMFSLLNTIPERERNLLFLKYCQGESIENLQDRFNLTASAVKMRLKRSKERLNAQYDMYMYATAA